MRCPAILVRRIVCVKTFVGIEFKPRELPSKLQMMKLAMNRRFIFAFKECMVELEKAGVDFTSEVCLQVWFVYARSSCSTRMQWRRSCPTFIWSMKLRQRWMKCYGNKQSRRRLTDANELTSSASIRYCSHYCPLLFAYTTRYHICSLTLTRCTQS